MSETRMARQEPTSFVVLYYKYVVIEDVEQFSKDQHDLCMQLSLTGRVRVAREGINGTLGGTKEHIEAYVASMGADDRFATTTIDWKTSWSERPPFPDLQVRVVNEIVSIDLPEQVSDPNHGGKHLDPTEFHELLSEGYERNNAIVLDVRNTYEYNIGHFDQAVDPKTRRFVDFPKWVRDHELALKQRKNVLMYCTGGIRCERASAYVKQFGIENVYQLKGGIHRYLEAFPDGGHFRGKNFVFDQRVSQCSEDPTVVGQCQRCKAPYDQISGIRCAYCRMHVMLCETCQELTCLKETFCPEHEYLKNPASHELTKRIKDLERAIHNESGRAKKKKRRSLKKQLDYLLSRQRAQ